MTLSLVLGAALGVLALPFAVVGCMYWMISLLRALHGLQASMRAFREEMRSYRLWREEEPRAREAVAPPPDYGPEPVDTARGPWSPPDADDPIEQDRRLRLRYRGIPPWQGPEPVVDTSATEFRDASRPPEDFGEAGEPEPDPTIAAGSKLAQPGPPAPGA